ncbi:retropepsin-like aspartic protease [Phyllobacterium leguminum]|uniref:Aspartyl protease n=1 Tax=Phyllobacterium leguminum TaxID=314237 RepID=A0A318T438_9HYPH|nr:retropepsin-like aspartic protease [Phyllobacterium leguminum]PYE87679.1 aspartyl protease [Phyllobacterium leguminum]
MRIYGAALLVGMCLCLPPAHAANSSDRNDLSGYLANRGAVIIPYALDSSGEMNVDAVLCPREKKCLATPLEFDSGDPDNNIGPELKEKLGLNSQEKTLARFYLGRLPPVTDFPIYFSNDPLRGNYIGARSIERMGLWFNFGSREIYGGIPRDAINAYMKGTALRYRTIALKSYGTYRYITVSINGKKPANFAIDTGATGSVIDTKYAHALGLGFDTKHCVAMGSQLGETRTCFTHDIVTMKAEKEPLSAYLPRGFADLDLGFVLPPLHIKGVLGVDWLERNAAIMSLTENRIYVPIVS